MDAQEIRAVIATSPAAAEALSSYARHLLNRGAHAEARVAGLRCIGIDPTDRTALNVLAYVAIARGDDGLSVRLARRILSLDPRDPGGFKMLVLSFACRHRNGPPPRPTQHRLL